MGRLRRAVAAALRRLGGPGRPAEGAAALLPDPASAFSVRVASARAASATLDLQYYIWRGDRTGRLLAREALGAADRGVAVRLLLDDVYALGRERTLAALDEHPRIAVRVFNATRWRRFGRLGMALELALGGWHLHRRMHNKAWIADGCLAVLGGRNIGDEYFGLDGEGIGPFRDLDVALLGPGAEQAARIFERYWSSPLARPAAEVAAMAAARGGLAALRAGLEEDHGPEEAAGRLAASARGAFAVLRHALTPVSARDARVIADPPEKVRRGLRARRRARTAGGIAADIADLLRAARREALLISPYFVPGADGLALLRELRARGVRVAVVTNSLAATDVVAVHGGYARYREALLAAGVELHELKPEAGEGRASLFGMRGVALHGKAIVVDGTHTFVGSFNLDPRSAWLNTEMGALIRCPRMAAAVAAEHARLADPGQSWALSLERGRLVWRDPAPSAGPEPGAGAWRRLLAAAIRRLPVEHLL